MALAASAIVTLPSSGAGAADDPCFGGPNPSPAIACGQVTVAGDRPGYVRLMLPSDAVVSLIEVGLIESRPQDITFTGDAPVIGVLFRDRTPAPDAREIAVIKLGREYSGYYYPHVTRHANLQPVDPEGDDRVLTIPAGTYDLYLITQPGTQAGVTVTFRGLEGATTLAPEHLVDIDYRPLPTRVPMGEGLRQQVASYGTTIPFEGEDKQFAFYNSAREGEALTLVQAWGSCFYDGAPDPEGTAYLPGCPGRVTSDTDAFELIFGPEVCPIGCFYRISYMFRGTYYELPYVPPGDYGTGTWWAIAPRAARTSAIAFVMDLQ